MNKRKWYHPSTWLIGLVRLYQKSVPRTHRGACRFTPTCSAYAIEALQRYGAVVGLALAVWRILRCNPFCRGGYDPVPEHLFFHRDKQK